MTDERDSRKEVPGEPIRAIVLHDQWLELAQTFMAMGRHGVSVVRGYSSQRDLITQLDNGTLPPADVLLTDVWLPKAAEDLSEAENAAVVIRDLRARGLNLPIIVVSDFAFSSGLDAERDYDLLRSEGAIVDDGMFRLGSLRSADLAASILEALSALQSS